MKKKSYFDINLKTKKEKDPSRNTADPLNLQSHNPRVSGATLNKRRRLSRSNVIARHHDAIAMNAVIEVGDSPYGNEPSRVIEYRARDHLCKRASEEIDRLVHSLVSEVCTGVVAGVFEG